MVKDEPPLLMLPIPLGTAASPCSTLFNNAGITLCLTHNVSRTNTHAGLSSQTAQTRGVWWPAISCRCCPWTL